MQPVWVWGGQGVLREGQWCQENRGTEALSDLLDYVENNKVDKVLIYECSRLSRRAVDFLAVIEQLIEQGVSVFGTVLNIPIAKQWSH